MIRHPLYIGADEPGPFLDNDFALIFLPNSTSELGLDITPVTLNNDGKIPAKAGDLMETFGWGESATLRKGGDPEHVKNDSDYWIAGEWYFASLLS